MPLAARGRFARWCGGCQGSASSRRAAVWPWQPPQHRLDMTAAVEDGSVVVTVTMGPSANQAAVRAELDRYTVKSRIAVR